jgi:hypothetical protein
VKVLCIKIKYPKHKMKVLPKPNIQKLILDRISPTKVWGIIFKLSPKKMPHQPSHMEKEDGGKVGFK